MISGINGLGLFCMVMFFFWSGWLMGKFGGRSNGVD